MADATPLSKPTIALHWLASALLLFMIPGGFLIDELPKGELRGGWIDFHRSLGVVVLVVALARLVWRIKEGFPPPLSDTPTWEKRLKLADHWLLLAAALAMPLSGLVMNLAGGRGLVVFGAVLVAKTGVKVQPWATLGAQSHEVLGFVIAGGVVLHLVGIARRALRSKDGTLRRMMGLPVTAR